MTSRSLKALSFSIIVMTCQNVFSKNLSWQACVDLTNQNSSELRGSVHAYSSTKELETVARAGFFPQVTGSLDFNRANSGIITEGSTFITTSVANSYGATLTASQNLFNGFKDKATYDQSVYNTKNSKASLDIVRAQVSLNLKTNYEALLYNFEYKKLTEDIIKRRQQDLSLVQMHYERGLENKGSVLLYKAYLAQAQFDDLQALHQRQSQQSLLAEVLGLDTHEAIEVSEPVPIKDPSNVEPNIIDMASSVPTHDSAIAQELSAREAMSINRSTFFPTLNVSGSAGKLDSKFFPGGDDHWSVGASLSFPLFSGGRDYSTYESSVYNFYSKSQSRMVVDRQLLATLRQAYNAYIESVEKLKVDESFRSAAIVRADIARGQYNNGLLNFQDWDNVETDLINRQKNYLSSKQNRVVAEAAWEQAQGVGVIK